MKDLPEFKDISDEEDRKAAYDKFIKRQQVRLFSLPDSHTTCALMSSRRK